MLNWEISGQYPFAEGLFSAASTVRWEHLKQYLAPGTLLKGPIYIWAPFGVFFDAGIGFPGLLEMTEFGQASGLLFPTDYPTLASEVSGQFVNFIDHSRQLRVVKSVTAR